MLEISGALLWGVVLCVVSTFVCASAARAQQRDQQPADLIFQNAKILTVDDRFSIAQAVAIKGQQVAAVGSNEDVLKLAGPNTQVLDLKGRTVIPGLIDTHRHIQMEAESAYRRGIDPAKLGRYPIDWRGVRSKDDVLSQIKGVMDKYHFKPGEWVALEAGQMSFSNTGGAERYKIINDELNRWELDKVTPDNPVALALGIQEHNEYLVNSKAVEILWAKYGNFIKNYGRYWLDSSGKPDGHMEMPASRLVARFLPAGSTEVLAGVYKNYIEEMNAMGVTAVATRLAPSNLKSYEWLDSRNDLTLRIAYGNEETFGTVTDLEKNMKVLGKTVGTGTDKIWVNSVAPTAADGSSARLCTNQKRIGSAAPIESKWWPQGQCFNDIEYRGVAGKGAPVRGNYFREWVMTAGRYGVRYADAHMSGDRTTSTIIQIVEQIQKQMGPAATRGWAFDHCFLVDPTVLKQAARLGIMFSCYMRTEQAAEIASYYGDKVAHNFMSPVKSMLDAGAKVVFESDRDGYDWEDLELFITRQDKKGRVWGPQERVDRETALKMITRWAADYILKGDKLGSIEQGKLADLVVLDKDYMTIPAEQIHTIQPQMTLFDGRIVFMHPRFAQEYNLAAKTAVVGTFKELLARRGE